MRNLALMWVLGGVVLLSASLYVYSENIDSADADYCLALAGTSLRLLLVKKYNDPVVLTAEEHLERKFTYSKYANAAVIDFIDTSGKSLLVFRIRGGMGGFSYDVPLPREIQRKLPTDLSPWDYEASPKEAEEMYKNLSQFKDKIIDGYITVSFNSEPRELEYKTKFRARITGECGCDLIKEE